MDRLIYTAYSGMSTSMTKQRMIANNMANAQTVGFRAEMLTTTPMTLKGPSLEARAMTDGEVYGADMKQGSIIATDNPLDIAMTGKTMLTVQADDGSEAYTRRGDLSVDATGLLVNGDGRPVIGSGGPITVPLGSKITVAPDGSVMAADPATPDTPPQVVDRIKLVSTDGSPIKKGIDGFFRVEGGGVLPGDEDARVVTGSLEQSNVNPADVLVQMIEAQRSFDIRTKLISTAREVDENSAALMRISS